MDAPSGAGYDFERQDHRQIIEVRSPRGVRGLHAALLQLALAVDERPSIERAYLIARFPRMSPHRVASEWDRVRRVLNPHAMRKLALVAIAGGDVVVLPDDGETRHLAPSRP